MRTQTVDSVRGESLGQHVLRQAIALWQAVMRRCRANADPFDSGFLPS